MRGQVARRGSNRTVWDADVAVLHGCTASAHEQMPRAGQRLPDASTVRRRLLAGSSHIPTRSYLGLRRQSPRRAFRAAR